MSDLPQLIWEPKVYLVGQQVINEDELQRFLGDEEVSHWESDAVSVGEKLAEVAGRLCYMSYAKPRPGGNSAYLGHIKESGHGSVLESAVYNLIFTGVSRSLTHELVRHRAGMSPSQLSQRYVDESDCEFVVPPDLQAEVKEALKFLRRREESASDIAVDDASAAMGLTWLFAMQDAQRSYGLLSEYLANKAEQQSIGNKTECRKFARQAARSVLPNATETKIFCTFNARAARHFIEMRCSRYAEAEIRSLALAMWRALVKVSPAMFGDYREVPLPDGSVELVTEYRKV
jgi:thymidylate synthase (FAD)